MYEGLKDSEISSQYFKQLLSNRGVQSLASERWKFPEVQIERLLQLGDDTFGRQYAIFISENGLDPTAIDQLGQIDNDIDYITHRLRHVHDMMHVILGFASTDLASEAGVASFNMSHIRSFFGAILAFGGLLHSLRSKDYDAFDDMLLATASGISMGMQARMCSKGSIFAYKFEDYWERPIADLRRDLNITPFTNLTRSEPTTGECRHF